MKTILQISKEIGVSKQAIRKRILREPLYTKIKMYLSTVDGIMYIDVAGETLIKSAYQKNGQQFVPTNQDENVYTNVHSDVYSVLKETINTLQKQLEIKDEQIKEKDKQLENKDTQILNLTEVNKNLSESINAAHHNELAETIIDGKQKLLGNNQKKRGFFNIFKKNK
jgi:hypothetical protein